MKKEPKYRRGQYRIENRKVKNVRINLEEPLYEKLKRLCVLSGQSMSKTIRQLISEGIR